MHTSMGMQQARKSPRPQKKRRGLTALLMAGSFGLGLLVGPILRMEVHTVYHFIPPSTYTIPQEKTPQTPASLRFGVENPTNTPYSIIASGYARDGKETIDALTLTATDETAEFESIRWYVEYDLPLQRFTSHYDLSLAGGTEGTRSCSTNPLEEMSIFFGGAYSMDNCNESGFSQSLETAQGIVRKILEKTGLPILGGSPQEAPPWEFPPVLQEPPRITA